MGARDNLIKEYKYLKEDTENILHNKIKLLRHDMGKKVGII